MYFLGNSAVFKPILDMSICLNPNFNAGDSGFSLKFAFATSSNNGSAVMLFFSIPVFLLFSICFFACSTFLAQ